MTDHAPREATASSLVRAEITEIEKAELLNAMRQATGDTVTLSRAAVDLCRRLCSAHDAATTECLNRGVKAGLLEAERDAARAKVACKGCGGTVGHHLAPDQGGCPGRFVIDGVPMVPAAHVDAARAEVERLRSDHARICEVWSLDLTDKESPIATHLTLRHDRLTAERDAARAEVARLEKAIDKGFCAQARAAQERDAAIRDRDKWRKLAEQITTVDSAAKHEFAASEVERFAAKLSPWSMAVQAAAAHRAAELRKAAGAAAPVDYPDETPETVAAEFAGAGAEVYMLTPDPIYATPPAAPALPRRECKAVDVATTAADARQPAGDALPESRLHELRDAYSKGSLVWRSEPTNTRCRDAVRAIDELLTLRARLAASEKAKAGAEARTKRCQDWYEKRWQRLRELMPKGSELEKLACDVIANGHLMTDAAERAGGAS